MAAGLTIATFSLDRGEGIWKHNRSLRRLLSTMVTKGDNSPKPGEAGTTDHPVLPDEVVVGMELIVYGARDQAGTPHASILDGLDTNLEYLAAWVASLADGATSSWPATLETNSGTVYGADVQVLNWQLARDDTTTVVISYDLRIPGGVWA